MSESVPLKHFALFATIGIVVIVGAVALMVFYKSSSSNTMTTTSDGLQIQILQQGSGAEAQSGQKVTVNYTGTLLDGTVFDSSVSRNQPFTFPLGRGQVIKGWDEGVAGMKVGEKRKLIIPPSLAYGAQTVGPIPANSILTFEIELISIQ